MVCINISRVFVRNANCFERMNHSSLSHRNSTNNQIGSHTLRIMQSSSVVDFFVQPHHCQQWLSKRMNIYRLAVCKHIPKACQNACVWIINVIYVKEPITSPYFEANKYHTLLWPVSWGWLSSIVCVSSLLFTLLFQMATNTLEHINANRLTILWPVYGNVLVLRGAPRKRD